MRKFSLVFGLLVSLMPCFSQDAYRIQESNSGLRSVLYSPLSESKAVELQQALDLPATLSPFRVFGTDIAPLLGFTNHNEGVELAYSISKNLAQDSADHFLLLFKDKPAEEDIINSTFQYRVYIKWPTTTTYDTLSPVIKESIRFELERDINQLVKVNTIYFSGNVIAESYCIDQFIHKVGLIQTEGLGINEEALLNSGFVEIPIEGANIENTSTLDVNNYDFAGLKYGEDFVKDNFLEAAQTHSAIFSVTNIFTDNDAIGSGLFQSANSEFGLASTDIVVWYHYYETTEGNRLFCKSRNTITIEDSKAIIDSLFNYLLSELNIEPDNEGPALPLWDNGNFSRFSNDCDDLLTWSAKECLLDDADILKYLTGGSEFNFGVACGVVDGFYQTILFLYDLHGGVTLLSEHIPFSGIWCIDVLKKVWNQENFKNYGIVGGVWQGLKDKYSSDHDYFIGLYESISMIINSYPLFFAEVYDILKVVFADISFQNGTKLAGYRAGQAVFEVILIALTGGTSSVSQLSKIPAQSLTRLKSVFNGANFEAFIYNARNQLATGSTWVRCKILLSGCFVSGTPIYMATNSIGQSNKLYTLAAALPLAIMPIDDVPLLSYALSHKSVNADYTILATNQYDVSMTMMSGDPYTSQEQKQRDLYSVNDTDWYEVSFEGMYSSSVCHMAMHIDWIDRHGYSMDTVIDLQMPEQGISGPFKITSIKHILPQKKPVADPGDDYEWKPVTGLFVHQSDQVMEILFSSGDTLGITTSHPIYSITYNDWRLAGELEVGEKVLSYNGQCTVIGTNVKPCAEPVYNLEIKDLHNFLAGNDGVVVHNNCIDNLFELFNEIIDEKGLTHILRGEINSAGKAQGVHHISAVDLGTARKVSGTQVSGPNGLYKVKVEVKQGENWVAKTANDGFSTFFPDSWDQIKVVEEIKHAYSNRVFVDGNEWMGYSKDGLIEIRMYLRADGKIITAFPKF